MQVLSAEGLDLIRSFESFRAKAYPDERGAWTCGYGTTRDVNKRTVFTVAQAEEALSRDTREAAACVRDAISAPLTQNQFDALVSFTYNCGCGALRVSTLRRKLNAQDYDGAANEFLSWEFVAGKRSDGLSTRRERERALFVFAEPVVA